jgi:hypothetical protein
MIHGLTGVVSNIQIVSTETTKVSLLSETQRPQDINLKKMAQWSMNYLIKSPRKELNYQPVFQCYPLKCPPMPEDYDPVVNGDTDARMDWEWYYMREISGSKEGLNVEAAFHNRIRDYIEPDGSIWTHPGCLNEGDTEAVYTEEDYIYHTWAATKILQSLSLDYIKTKNEESKLLAQKVMQSLKKVAVWKSNDTCYFKQGMGGLYRDGSVMPNGWNTQPAPLIEPLVNYYKATGDKEGLDFAIAYTNGVINGSQPNGIRFKKDGSFRGHTHATMHVVWGIADLGLVIGKNEYIDFAKHVWNFVLSRGTGTGWFPAGPDNCDETCAVSDMISTAACIAQAGYPEYYDYIERYFRNYISNAQFFITDKFKEYYREINSKSKPEEIERSLITLRRVEGAILGGKGLNDYENELLGGASGFAMYGCCAPEGMRAIYTTWTNTIQGYSSSPLGPEGVYINMCFSRDSPWGEVVSFMPKQGRLTVKSSVEDVFFIRPPHWVPKDMVKAFVNAKSIPVEWSGNYISFNAKKGDELTITYPLIKFEHTVEGLWKSCAPNLKMKFFWLGNMVISTDPAPNKTPLFIGKPRILCEPPKFE